MLISLLNVVGNGVFFNFFINNMLFQNEFYVNTAYVLLLFDVITKQNAIKLFLKISKTSFMIFHHRMNPPFRELYENLKK